MAVGEGEPRIGRWRGAAVFVGEAGSNRRGKFWRREAVEETVRERFGNEEIRLVIDARKGEA